MKKSLNILLALGAVLGTAHATIFINEPFNYADGALTTVSGGVWTAHSAPGTNSVAVSGGMAVLTQGSGTREDVNTSTGTTIGAGQTWFAGFDVSVSGGSTTVYFANFLQNSTTFGGRVFVTSPSSGGDFSFGLSGSGSSPSSVWASDLTFGQTYRLVVSYDYDSGASQLWVNPTQASDTSLSSTGFVGDAMYGFALRQASGNSVETIDNLFLADNFSQALTGSPVPEPGALALTVFGALAFLGFNARRRSS